VLFCAVFAAPDRRNGGGRKIGQILEPCLCHNRLPTRRRIHDTPHSGEAEHLALRLPVYRQVGKPELSAAE
jgi:hypothetical protein